MPRNYPNHISQAQPAVNVYTSGEYQFASYWRLDGALVVARRHRPTETFGVNHDQVVIAAGSGAAATELDVPVHDDEHNYCSIFVDPQGRIHVWGNMHNDPLRYVRSNASHTTDGWLNASTGWSAATMPTEETNHTYPTPVFLRPGHVTNEHAFFYIRGGDGGTRSGMTNAYNWWMDDSGNWSAKRLFFQGLSIPGAAFGGGTGSGTGFPGPATENLTNFSPYPTNFHIEEDDRPHPGRMHMSWIWRHTGTGQEPSGEFPDARSNFLPCYAYSDNNGRNWNSIDGTALTIPITPLNNLAARIPGGARIVSISRSQDFGGLVIAVLDQPAAVAGIANGNHVFVFNDTHSFDGEFDIVNSGAGAGGDNNVAWLQAGATETGQVGTITRQNYLNWGSICTDLNGMPHIIASLSSTRYIRRNASNTAWTESSIANPFNGQMYTVKMEAFWIRNQLWGATMSSDPERRVIIQRLTGPNLPEVKQLSDIMGGSGWDVSRDQVAYYLHGSCEIIAPRGDTIRLAAYGGSHRLAVVGV